MYTVSMYAGLHLKKMVDTSLLKSGSKNSQVCSWIKYMDDVNVHDMDKAELERIGGRTHTMIYFHKMTTISIYSS